jgi:hypothetical protein
MVTGRLTHFDAVFQAFAFPFAEHTASCELQLKT